MKTKNTFVIIAAIFASCLVTSAAMALPPPPPANTIVAIVTPNDVYWQYQGTYGACSSSPNTGSGYFSSATVTCPGAATGQYNFFVTATNKPAGSVEVDFAHCRVVKNFYPYQFKAIKYPGTCYIVAKEW